MFTKSKITQSMIDAVNSVISEGKEKLLLEPELDETGFHKAAHAAKKANQTHFEFQGKKYPVTAKSHAEAVAMEEEKSEKVHTPTGMKVYGHRYGNAAKAHRDQTKHELDKMKGPKEKDLKEEGDCVTKPEAKDIAKKEVKGHEKKMHHAEEMTLAHKWKEKAKAKIKENKGSGPQETFTDNNMGEEVRKSDVPAYLRKQKGEKPLTVADVKGPKKDTISHPENLAKARNEEVELNEDNLDTIAKNHGMEFKRTTYGAGMKHPTKGEVSINRYGEWHHYPAGSKSSKAHGDSTSNFSSLDKHLSTLKEGVELTEAEVTTHAVNPNEVTTDMIRGRVQGGKSNSFKGYKLQLKTDGEMKAPPPEEGEKDTPAMKTRKTHEPIVNLPNLKMESATEVEIDAMINEVLSKDADAGDWIHDFVHSKNPKFAGKSKAERKKMALGAYYAKQNEEAGEGAWHKETPWKKSPDTVTDKSGAKHTPMSRAKDLARSAFKKLKNETMMGKISN